MFLIWFLFDALEPHEHIREFYDEPLKQGQQISAPENFVRIADECEQNLLWVLCINMFTKYCWTAYIFNSL